MLTTFRKTWPLGEPTHFDELVPPGLKPQTIRRHLRGHRQRVPGKPLHFWSGNPRNPTKLPFALDMHLGSSAYWMYVKESHIVRDADLDIDSMPNFQQFEDFGLVSHKDAVPVLYALEEIDVKPSTCDVWVGGVPLNAKEIFRLSRYDGFESVEKFFDYFYPEPEEKGVWSGEILHWTTGALYNPENANVFDQDPVAVRGTQLKLEMQRVEKDIKRCEGYVGNGVSSRHEMRNSRRLELLRVMREQIAERINNQNNQ